MCGQAPTNQKSFEMKVWQLIQLRKVQIPLLPMQLLGWRRSKNASAMPDSLAPCALIGILIRMFANCTLSVLHTLLCSHTLFCSFHDGIRAAVLRRIVETMVNACKAFACAKMVGMAFCAKIDHVGVLRRMANLVAVTEIVSRDSACVTLAGEDRVVVCSPCLTCKHGGNAFLLISRFFVVAQRAKCDGGCSGHGTCLPGGICRCTTGFSGSSCSWGPGCPNFCSGNGQCVNNSCQCGTLAVDTGSRPQQYTGPACAVLECVSPTCSGHGVCDAGECICEYVQLRAIAAFTFCAAGHKYIFALLPLWFAVATMKARTAAEASTGSLAMD